MGERTGTRVVPAGPQHARFLAWVSLAAARSHVPRGFWDFYLDTDEDEILRYIERLANTSKPHLFHHSAFLVAEVDGRPAAGLCGYFEEENGVAALNRVLGEVDKQFGRKPSDAEAGLARASAFFTVAPEHTPRTWIVENVATHPDYRRRGLIRLLLDAVLARGRTLDAERCELGLLTGNEPARRAYEDVGFDVASEKRSAEFQKAWGCPGITLMARDL
jgi:GNAT superfamily N-acetyltransferase